MRLALGVVAVGRVSGGRSAGAGSGMPGRARIRLQLGAEGPQAISQRRKPPGSGLQLRAVWRVAPTAHAQQVTTRAQTAVAPLRSR